MSAWREYALKVLASKHSPMQRRSIALFASLDDVSALRAAREHHDAIARFGRFPYRNAALARESTDEERAFLAGLPKR